MLEFDKYIYFYFILQIPVQFKIGSCDSGYDQQINENKCAHCGARWSELFENHFSFFKLRYSCNRICMWNSSLTVSKVSQASRFFISILIKYGILRNTSVANNTLKLY